MKIVTNAADLATAIKILSSADVLAVDTEFMREKTYYPKLCLIQIARKEEVIIIDPLPEKLDLTPLAQLWSDPNIVKVFHAGAQDLRILFDNCGAAPRPYFDTQDAATLIGQSEQVGYATLVHKLLGVELNKADSFTDWARRPLTKAQLDYASKDVSYLLQLYPLIVSELSELGRQDWLASEFEQKSSDETLSVDTQMQFRRLKRVSSLKPHQLAIAREIAAWRENEAAKRNIPKRWLLSDESILDISRRAPRTPEELEKLRGVGNNLKRSLPALVSAIETGINCPQDQWPSLPERPRVSGDDSAALELMAALVRKRADENRLSSSVLASRAILENYLSTRRDDCMLMQGWRREIIGNEISRLLEGELCLRFSNGCLLVEDYKSDEVNV
jgi:ribonuclease D